jgi:ABC-type transporter Mla subunit MlaD
MANFDDVTLFGNTSLSDIFKQIHRNNKDTDKQINELIDALKPLASSNAGSAVMLMPTVKDLIDVNVKNNEQLIKMAGIAQRASTASASNNQEIFFDPSEIQQLLEEQRAVQQEGQKLLDQTETIQHKIENK